MRAREIARLRVLHRMAKEIERGLGTAPNNKPPFLDVPAREGRRHARLLAGWIEEMIWTAENPL